MQLEESALEGDLCCSDLYEEVVSPSWSQNRQWQGRRFGINIAMDQARS